MLWRIRVSVMLKLGSEVRVKIRARVRVKN